MSNGEDDAEGWIISAASLIRDLWGTMMSTTATAASWEADAKTEKLMRSASRILRPVLELLLKHIHGSVLIDLILRLIVDIAEKQALAERPPEQRDQKVTLSEINLKTGLDTRRIRKYQKEPLVVTEHNISIETLVLSRWAKDPALRERHNPGKPCDLIAYGRGGTFEGLVKSVSGRGVSPTSLLERLVKRGNVQWVGKHHVRLINPVWQFMEDGLDDMLEIASLSFQGLSSTVQYNVDHIADKSNRRIQRQLVSYHIPKAEWIKVQTLLKDIVGKARKECLAVFDEYEQPGVQNDGEIIGVGLYLFCDKASQYNVNMRVL